MEIVPAIDLKDGNCVQLVGGVFGSEKFQTKNIEKILNNFYNSGIKRLHVVDLDSAKSKGDNIEIIDKILKNKKTIVEVGGGIRSIKKAKELINKGADYVIVGTVAIENPDFLKQLSDVIGKEKIIVSLDYKNGKVVTHGWDKKTMDSPIEVAKKMQHYCDSFLLTCVDKEGRLNGPDIDYLKKANSEIDSNIIASGGISSIDDIKNLKSLGISGAVVGMAIYNGQIDLKETANI